MNKEDEDTIIKFDLKKELTDIWKFITKDWLLICMFILYSVFLIFGTKNIVEHNTRIIQCNDLGMVKPAGGKCMTKQEYNNLKEVNDITQDRLKLNNFMSKKYQNEVIPEND